MLQACIQMSPEAFAQHWHWY